MGRPLRKKFFGELAEAGTQLVLTAYVGGSAKEVSIVEQKGTGVYLVTDNINTYRVKLVNKAAPTAEGEAVLVVTPHGGSAEYARILLTNDVKTFAGNTYKWQTATTSIAGTARILNETVTATVTPLANSVAPAITGTATVGQTLTTTNGTWTGEGTITYKRQWMAGGVAIAGATGTTFVLTSAQLGAVITVAVTAKTTVGQSLTVNSNATAAVS